MALPNERRQLLHHLTDEFLLGQPILHGSEGVGLHCLEHVGARQYGAGARAKSYAQRILIRSFPSPTCSSRASSPLSRSALFSLYISLARLCIVSTTLLSLCRRFMGIHSRILRRNPGVPMSETYGIAHRNTDREYSAGLDRGVFR